MEGWFNGNFDSSFSAEYIARNSAAKGCCSAYDEILNLEVDDLYE